MKNVFEIELVLPCKKHQKQVEEYKQKFKDSLSSIVGVGIHGCGSLDSKSFDEWLAECNDYRVGKNLPEGYVPATQFLAIRKNDSKLVGMIQVRHALTPHLERIGGHVGYSIAPDERRKGYATMMLILCLDVCKKLGIDKVRVSCVKSNIASRGVILNCGGEYDGDSEYDGQTFERYWIYI